MFADTFKELRTKADLFQNDIANKLNVTQQTVAKWEAGKAMPSVEMICTIANYFNISTDYLLGLTEYKNIDDQALIKSSALDSTFENLSSASRGSIIEICKQLISCIGDYESIRSEKYVDINPGFGEYLLNTVGENIKAYQAAADYLKKQKSLSSVIYKFDEMLRNADQSLKFIEALADDFASNNKIDGDNFENILYLPHAVQPVSAGSGTYVTEECMEKIKVMFNKQTARADFCVTVSGESMEPKFHDEDVLLVHEQPDIERGEFGIFVINDEGFVKQRGEKELISLNPNYENIPFYPDDDILCGGKVIGILNQDSILI